MTLGEEFIVLGVEFVEIGDWGAAFFQSEKMVNKMCSLQTD